MKLATSKLASALMLLGALILTGCGSKNTVADNGDTTSQTSCATPSGNVPCRTTTHLRHRAVVSNFFAGTLGIVDATQNRATNFSFKVGAQPTTLQQSPDGTLSLVNNTGSNTLSSFNNLQEAVKATIQLGGFTQSYVTTVGNNAGFAAVPNYSNGDFNVPGAIVRFNPTDGSLNTAIPFANVRILALDPAEQHLLAFTDSDDDAHWVDLTKLDPVTQLPTVTDLNQLPLPAISLPAGTLSRPVAAFFSSDGKTAYILNCGGECGGTDAGGILTAPSVTAIDVSNDAAAPAVLAGWPVTVKGARIGLMDLVANKLYVAGSMTTSLSNDCAFLNLPSCDSGLPGNVPDGGHNVQDGWFSVINLATATASSPLRIGNGVKHLIRNINGAFWVASLNCGVESCVSRVNSAATTASVLDTAKGDATGLTLAAIHGDSTDDVYTVEGGELFIYDQQGTPVVSEFSTDFVGEIYDVVYIN